VTSSRELGKALRAWRDRTAPATAGVAAGGARRAAGLRREELAQLAGLSVDYIIRLEQGRATSPSPQVLSALARALHLSAAEREHLYLLAGQQAPSPGNVPTHLPPSVRRLLAQLDGAPLSVYDAAWNLILCNPSWAALLGDASTGHGRERNVAWRIFGGLPSRVCRTPMRHADRFEAAVVTDLRAATVRYPTDAALRSLIKDLRAVSTEFAHLWDTAAVGVHQPHTRTIHQPAVGTLTLDCDILTAPGGDLRIVAFTAAPGSDTADRLKRLNDIVTRATTEAGAPQPQQAGTTPPHGPQPGTADPAPA
jgi:transcriptional regulator with XRE-family HTH domain